ncbi:PFS domain-containing protein [Pochonia chlamydosporia 170]|uniref:PFS domain-containing protein n=1 Tax=Pochonia chlamydosporia 170 TaxID=1380566 RepID=A0A179FCN5_METCM|nr:PFS domain-containing protein [Pochonia chlamydosporia 170]OAQ63060.1 PFS domain-containing protein [Pochonia chlamydosporia 170]
MPAKNGVSKQYEDYTVAVICAIDFEMSAVRYMLDREHNRLRPRGDSNTYVLGELSGHNVVLACLPGNQGKGAAAIVATNVSRSFPAIKSRFLVGIGGGVPSEKHSIRLGDVVVSMPDGEHGGVVQYDLGKDTVNGFWRKGFLCPPPARLRSAVGMMKSDHLTADNKINDFLSQMVERSHRLRSYARPSSGLDVLYEPDYPHVSGQPTCTMCDLAKVITRQDRPSNLPEIHYGLIASGDRVFKSAAKRDQAVRALGDILCFEMEAAGIATEFSCIVIRGISDYADSHKNDSWHHYAAAAAAACAKELLSYLEPEDMRTSSSYTDSGSPSGVLPNTGSRPLMAAEYRAKLGEWAAEAMDSHGRWLQPILGTNALEEHLLREEGRPKPSRLCESSLAWAQLLYALNVRPGMGVLAWKLPPKEIDPSVEAVRLQVDGPAMCHIVNLFRIYREPSPMDFSPGGSIGSQYLTWAETTCDFPFGTIRVDLQAMHPELPDKVKTVAFEPGSLQDLEQQRLPFSHKSYPCGYYLQETHLKFKSSTLMPKYFDAVYSQGFVADTASIGPLPGPGSPLLERAQYYLQSTKLLQPHLKCSPQCTKDCVAILDRHKCTRRCKGRCSPEHTRLWSRPRLVTHGWLRGIERIKRRVTTNGGDDDALLSFFISSLEERPQFVQDVKQIFHKFGMFSNNWKSEIRCVLEQRLMFTNQQIEIIWGLEVPSPQMLMEDLDLITCEQLPGMLVDLAANRDGGWLHRLSSLTDELDAMMRNSDTFSGVPVIVLELGPSHTFWKDTFEIKGE